MVTLAQHNVAVLYPLKSVSADDNINCFYQILMICSEYIDLVKTLNGTAYECFTILVMHMMTRHVTYSFSATKLLSMIVQLCGRWDILRCTVAPNLSGNVSIAAWRNSQLVNENTLKQNFMSNVVTKNISIPHCTWQKHYRCQSAVNSNCSYH